MAGIRSTRETCCRHLFYVKTGCSGILIWSNLFNLSFGSRGLSHEQDMLGDDQNLRVQAPVYCVD